MLSEKFRAQKKHELNMKKIPRTESFSMMVKLLTDDSDIRLTYSPHNEYGSDDRPSYAGAWVIRLRESGSRITRVDESHGKRIITLFNTGVIEVDFDITVPHPRVTIFKLSDEIKNDLRTFRRNYVLEAKVRITQRLLDNIAAYYSLSLNFDRVRGLFTVGNADGSLIVNTGLGEPYIYHRPDNTPLLKMHDMTPHEWEEVLCAKAKYAKKNQIIEVNDDWPIR